MPPEVGSVKDKIGRFGPNSLPGSHRESGKDFKDGAHFATQHHQHDAASTAESPKDRHDRDTTLAQDLNRRKPSIPRKPIALSHTNGPDMTEICAAKHQLETREPSSVSHEAMAGHEIVDSPQAIESSDGKSPSSQPSSITTGQWAPSVNRPKPRLPPRKRTVNHGQSLGPALSTNSTRSMAFDHNRPKLPPRPETIPVPQGNAGYPSSAPLRATASPEKRTPPLPSPQRRARDVSRTNTPSGSLHKTNQRRINGGPGSEYGRTQDIGVHIPRKGVGNIPSKITQEECKQYEAVWAEHKGLFVPGPTEPFYDMYPPGASDMVLNIVVREIWLRSRLPDDILQKIWGFVDRQGIRLLSREEFVVGMWLIDQQLNGHQLPPKVPDNIWDSVKSFPGDTLLD